MKIVREIQEIPGSRAPVVTIGTFDGVHRGHRRLIEKLIERKRAISGQAYLITFEPHPQLVLNTRKPPIKILTTLEEKIALLQQFELDYIVVLPFSEDFARITGEEFIDQILLKKIGAVEIVIGYDHAFGYRRTGNIDTLRQYEREKAFRVHVVEPYYVGDEPVKSSRIRELLLAGEVQHANELLGYPYALTGRVVKGKGRGRKLSFPTANIAVNHSGKLLPADGIYVAEVQLEKEGRWRRATVSVGIRPTFGETQRTVEAFILQFRGEIYGETIRVRFHHRLREEKKFDKIEDLVNQMKLDVEETERYFELQTNGWRDNAAVKRGESKNH